MPGSVFLKGQIRLTLPLKSTAPTKKFRSPSRSEDEQREYQASRQWPKVQTDLPSQAVLALKKRTHQYYKRQAQKRGFASSPMQLNSPPVDPFSTWPIRSTPGVPRMAQYFVQVWAPEHGCAFAIEGHSNPYLSLLWPFALQDAMYFESLVSLCLATWLPSQGIRAQSDKLFLYHRGNVIAELRQRLQDPSRCSDNATILTIATLGTIDYVNGEHATAPDHVAGMRRIVSMRGHLDVEEPMEQLLQINIAAYEALWSFVMDSSPRTDQETNQQSLLQQGLLPTYLNHPFKPEVCAMLSRLPQGFCDLGLQGKFSLQMMQVLSALNNISLNATFDDSSPPPLTPDSATSSPSSPPPLEIPRIPEILNNLNRLATLQTNATEHLLCFALMSYCHTLHDHSFQDTFRFLNSSTIESFTKQCIQTPPSTDAMDRSCFLWSAAIIGTTLMNINYSTSSRFVILEHLIAKYGECQQWHLLADVMSDYLWNPGLEVMVRKAWDETMDKINRPSRMRIRDVIL